ESHGVKTVDWNQVTSIVQYDERTFWIGTGDQGLYRVIVTGSDPNDLESYRFEKWNQNAAETLGVTWAHVEMLDDQLYLICDTGLYIYNKERNHFFYRDNLGDDLGNNVYNVTVFKQDNDSFWVLYQTGDAVPRLKKLTRYGTHLRGQEFFAPALHEAAVPRSFVVSPDESKIIISGENLVCSSLISELPVISAPEVARILVDGQVVREADIDGFFSSVDIAVASPDATSTDVQYRFRENNEPWTEWSDSPIHHLYDPDDGDILSYQSIASGASISDVGSIALAVNPPVWLKPHSIALYAATVFGGVYCLASAYRRRFMKRLAQVESEHLEELEVVKEKCERDLEGMRAKLMESHEVSQVAQDAGTTNLRVAAHGFKSLVSSGLAHIRVILSDTAISVRSQASLGAMKLLFRKIDINFQGVFQLEDLEKGTVQLENESIELIPFSTEMVECFQMEATAQGVHYNWDFGNFEEVLVMDFYGDRTMLERILFNLIGNALRHSKDGKDEPLVRVYPSTRQVDGKTELTLSIEDNGLGVPEGEEDNIFRKFYTTAEDGSGLGLYLSKLMAESMGGTLRCERSRHGGAAFILSIPFSPPGVISREGKQTPNV
ncbi:MAG: HAMP domain-containing sensor histidine kinase, partial [Verrucomicrobiota bacterium]